MTTQIPSEVREITASGGVDLPERFLDDSWLDSAECPTDELGRRLYILMSLHPDVEFGIRKEELATLDTPTKETVLRSACEALSITPLQNTKW